MTNLSLGSIEDLNQDELKELFNKINSLTGDNKNNSILIVCCLTLGICVIKPLVKYYLQLRYGKKKNSKNESPATTASNDDI